MMNLTQQVVPMVSYKKLRYHESMGFTINDAFTAQHTWGLNCLYDPYLGIGGHQPYGFDEMMALYNRGVVLGAKVTVLARPGSTANSYASNLYGEISNLSSLQYTSASHGWEKPGVKVITFNGMQGNTGSPEKRMTFWYSAKKYFRARDRQELITNDAYRNTSSANPASKSTLFLTYAGQGYQQTTMNLAVDVTIDYICAFTDRKQLLQS